MRRNNMLIDLCDVAVENAAILSDDNQDEFRNIRQQGLGASDSSVVLGVNPFPDNNIPELMRQKLQKNKTAVEQKIGSLASVRKGSDLEHLILDKFCEKFGVEVLKPLDMYKLKQYPYIRINYDGLLLTPDEPEVPVEIKLITIYGMKYYNKDKAIMDLSQDPIQPVSNEVTTTKYIKDMAKQSGIPVYYYTQLQQQMLGTGAPYAYLVGMDDGKWELIVWKIYRDQRTIETLIEKASALWGKIENLKN